MRPLRVIAVIFLVTATATATFAQQISTVGDILNQGGRKLSKEEIQRLYMGATVSGHRWGMPEITFQNKLLPDGTVTGTALRNGQVVASISGRWSITNNAQTCFDLNNNTEHNCFYYYNLSNRYYAAQSEDKSAPAYERQFTR